MPQMTPHELVLASLSRCEKPKDVIATETGLSFGTLGHVLVVLEQQCLIQKIGLRYRLVKQEKNGHALPRHTDPTIFHGLSPRR